VHLNVCCYILQTHPCCLCRSLELSCSTDALCHICQRHIQYFDESFRLAVEHRLVHEHDGKPPLQPVMKPKAFLAESSHTSESAASTNSDVVMEMKAASIQSQQPLRQSAVADARNKFEQVLQASRQAAAAGSIATTSASVLTHSDKKQLITDASAAVARCQKPENGLMSSLLYSQLVYAARLNFTLLFLFTVYLVVATCHACKILCVNYVDYLSYDIYWMHRFAECFLPEI